MQPIIILGLLLSLVTCQYSEIPQTTYSPNPPANKDLEFSNPINLHKHLEKMKEYKACFGGPSPVSDLNFERYCNPSSKCQNPQKVLTDTAQYIKSNLHVPIVIGSGLNSILPGKLLEPSNLNVMCNEYVDPDSNKALGFNFYSRAKTVIFNDQKNLNLDKGKVKFDESYLVFAPNDNDYEIELMDLCNCGTVEIYNKFKNNPDAIPLPNNLISKLDSAEIFKVVGDLCFTDQSKEYLKGLKCNNLTPKKEDSIPMSPNENQYKPKETLSNQQPEDNSKEKYNQAPTKEVITDQKNQIPTEQPEKTPAYKPNNPLALQSKPQLEITTEPNPKKDEKEPVKIPSPAPTCRKPLEISPSYSKVRKFP